MPRPLSVRVELLRTFHVPGAGLAQPPWRTNTCVSLACFDSSPKILTGMCHQKAEMRLAVQVV